MRDPDAMKAKFRRRGARITPHRGAIIGYLRDHEGHPSAEEILNEVGRDRPSLSMSTVYETLRLLSEMGEIREVQVGPERKRFDPVTESHCHAVCEKCGALENVHARSTRGFDAPPGLTRRFRIDDGEAEFLRVCDSCIGVR